MNQIYFKCISLPLGIVLTLCSVSISQDAAWDGCLMCTPTEIMCSDDFESESVAERWGFRAFYEVEDGTLKRTPHEATEPARSFLKNVSYRNAIIRFDVKFEGATDIRLMTGGGGGYNTVTQLFPSYFQVNTARRKTEFNPSQQGECAFKFKRGKWHTVTIEFKGDEVVAHVDHDHFVIGRHPIIDTERTYLAFQVSGGAASFDNFVLSRAKPKSTWPVPRASLNSVQAARGDAFQRNAKEEYDLIIMNLKDRLSRNDSEYRRLVAAHANAEALMKNKFPSANQTRKELGKQISEVKKELRKTEPRFKEMEHLLNLSRRTVKDYVHSVFPELDAIPKQTYYWRYEECLTQLGHDKDFLRLVKLAEQSEKRLHNSFPEAFQDLNALVDERKLSQTQMKSNEDYRELKNKIAETKSRIDAFLLNQDPRLGKLAEARLAIIKTNK